MRKHDFNSGDEVECVDCGGGDYLTNGALYVIHSPHEKDPECVYVLDDTGAVNSFYAKRFIRAKFRMISGAEEYDEIIAAQTLMEI